MFRNLKPKDISVLLLTITLCTILIISTISIVFLERDTNGRIEELIAFLLGSITTIVGEYVLLNLKRGKKEDCN
tara:strand:- start:30830 stop:31051 length:222 start_codon:yes stop_codon:yes gene_type:complete